jgi:hypothetical protein
MAEPHNCAQPDGEPGSTCIAKPSSSLRMTLIVLMNSSLQVITIERYPDPLSDPHDGHSPTQPNSYIESSLWMQL